MSSYMALLSGLLLAFALVNHHALAADSDESAVDLASSTSTDSVEEVVVDGENEATAAVEIGLDTINAEEAEETSATEELVTSADEVSNDGEASVTDNNETITSETVSFEDILASTNSDKVQPSYKVTVTADGQSNTVNITGKNISESIKFSISMPIRVSMIGDVMSLDNLAYTNTSDKLVLLNGHKCTERTYSAGTAVSERNMTTAECHQVVADMQRVQFQAGVIARLRHELDEALAHPLGGEQPPPPRTRGGRGRGRGGHHRHRPHGKRLLNRLLASSTAQNAQPQTSA